MKYKKVQLLKEAVQELGINCVEAAYKLGVRYETLQQMFRRGNIVIDGAVYQPTRHEVLNNSFKPMYLVEYLKAAGITHDNIASDLGLKRQTVTIMVGKGCVVYLNRIYSPKKYRLK